METEIRIKVTRLRDERCREHRIEHAEIGEHELSLVLCERDAGMADWDVRLDGKLVREVEVRFPCGSAHVMKDGRGGGIPGMLFRFLRDQLAEQVA